MLLAMAWCTAGQAAALAGTGAVFVAFARSEFARTPGGAVSLLAAGIVAGMAFGLVGMDVLCGPVRRAACSLLAASGAAAVAPALFALHNSGWRTRRAIGRGLVAHLDRLSVNDGRHFTRRDRQRLYAILRSQPLVGRARADTDVARAVVRACAVVGGREAAPLLRRLARRRRDAAVAAEARDCLQALENRLRREAEVTALPRAAAPPPDADIELLRPGDAVWAHRPGLLRAATAAPDADQTHRQEEQG